MLKSMLVKPYNQSTEEANLSWCSRVSKQWIRKSPVQSLPLPWINQVSLGKLLSQPHWSICRLGIIILLYFTALNSEAFCYLSVSERRIVAKQIISFNFQLNWETTTFQRISQATSQTIHSPLASHKTLKTKYLNYINSMCKHYQGGKNKIYSPESCLPLFTHLWVFGKLQLHHTQRQFKNSICIASYVASACVSWGGHTDFSNHPLPLFW